MEEKTYSVYEIRGNGKSYIGSVTAESKESAIDVAHDKYGAPIEVQ